jgi:CRISPR/Cas system CMR subunit Cmr4 (Cas7 group RAMP superfamily)
MFPIHLMRGTMWSSEHLPLENLQVLPRGIMERKKCEKKKNARKTKEVLQQMSSLFVPVVFVT